ncbi:amidohydrolase [Pseudidiomarina mangrovi]|uniref:amidohydrolase n=1 Tax=Pseudidiomarina mangrovi TaxID=2487133 RepID=UPI000FCC054C|nr:amidohydrolase [Pseudidiomarina mangrovi]
MNRLTKTLHRQRLLASISLVALMLTPAFASAESTLYYNLQGYTLTGPAGADATLVEFKAFAVRDGKVIAVGEAADVERVAGDVSKRVDLGGKTVLPGIIDAHGHVLGLGQTLQLADLRDASSEQQAVAMVTEFANSAGQSASWVLGRGWNQENWSSRQFPSAAALDESLSDRPVWLTRVDGHAGWANSKALELAGITGASVSPEGGEIIRDSNGEPTGVLIDNAMNLVEAIIPADSAEQQKNALQLAFAHLNERGITSVHDAGVSAETIDVFQQLAASDAMTLRVYAMIGANEPKLPELLANGPIVTDDDMFTVRSVKIYADGALGSRGAALLHPYHDDPQQLGLLVTSPENIKALYELIIPHGFQINTHAIGDRANRIALDAFEHAFNSYGGRNLRHRIEHAQVVHPDDLIRFKTLNIIPSMQPTHATSDKNMAEDRLGKERMRGAYAWQTFLKQGSIIAAGSDFPVELADPFFGLHAAVTRQDRDNQPEGGWYPAEAMSKVEALRSFTLDAAYAAGQDSILGSIEPGKWADFIVLDQNPFAQTAATLWQQRVLATYIAGEAVYTIQMNTEAVDETSR